MTKVGVLGQD